MEAARVICVELNPSTHSPFAFDWLAILKSHSYSHCNPAKHVLEHSRQPEDSDRSLRALRWKRSHVGFRKIAVLVVTLAGGMCPALLFAQIDSANSLFKAGKFAEAQKIYSQVADKTKDGYALQQLGYIALLGNQLDDAEKWLQKAIAVKPDNSEAKIMLAEAFYRQDHYAKAAAILKQIGPSYLNMTANYPTLLLPQLESFQSLVPYQLHGRGQTTTVPFVKERATAGGERARERQHRRHLLHRYRRIGVIARY